MNDPFPDEVDDALWDEACRRADAIRDFLRQRPGHTTAGDVAGLAAELGLSQATAYRLIKLFRGGGTVLSLVGRSQARAAAGSSHFGRKAGGDHPHRFKFCGCRCRNS